MSQPDELTDDAENALWSAWRQGDNPAAARQHLIEHYLPFAHMLAARLYAGRHIQQIEFEEFRQYAVVGMMEALDRYDASRNASFKTYAAHRITGAVLNGIEKSCEKQQQIAAKSNRKQQRLESIRSDGDQDDRPASRKDLFSELADLAIGLALGYILEDSGMYHAQEEQYTENFYDRYELRQLRQMMARHVDVLPEQAQCVIRYHYYQGLNFEEIAGLLSLSKGRISQIHSQALKSLRKLHSGTNELNVSL